LKVAEGADGVDPQGDPDFIAGDGSEGGYTGVGYGFAPGALGTPPTVFVPKVSTPLAEDDAGGAVPHFALWAMKYQRHAHIFRRTEVEIREARGDGYRTVYLIDDGRDHAMVCRMVGSSPDGCTYCLVGRITMESHERLIHDGGAIGHIFSEASELCVCSVYEAEEAVSNVALVETFASIDEVPTEYLPPNPPLEFTDT